MNELKNKDITEKIIGVAFEVHTFNFRAYRIKVGLLINFGSKSLTFKRVVL
jgi:hypothetical protein